jgi:hypothetical protein
VEILSEEVHVGPVIRMPERHSTTILGLPPIARTDPDRSIPAGLRTLESAESITSKPFIASEPEI